MRLWLAAVHVFMAIPAIAAAELPAPGSTYHLLFASNFLFRTTTTQTVPPPSQRFGNIAGANYLVTESAFSASIPGTSGWNGTAPIYNAIISISGDNASSRLSVDGPVYNMRSEQLATGKADLFDGSLAAAVGYDEYGQAIVDRPEVWTGSTGIGIWSGSSCGAWNSISNMTTGRVGNPNDTTPNWLSTGANRTCSQSARLYGLSPALVAPLWGDYDASGAVDGSDFLDWQRQLGVPPAFGIPSDEFWAARAFTSHPGQDKSVNAADLGIWMEYFGQSLPPLTAVPEPATGVILLVGMAVCGRWRRSRLLAVPEVNGNRQI